MEANLSNINVVVNDDLAEFEKTKSIKTKPETFQGTKNFFLTRLKDILQLSREPEGLSEEELEIVQRKIERLKALQANYTIADFNTRKHLVKNKPIKIKKAMQGNVVTNYDNYELSLQQEEKQQQVEQVQEVVGKTLQEIEQEEIQAMLNKVKEEKEPVIERQQVQEVTGKTIQEIEQEEVAKLMHLIRIKDIINNSKSLREIEEEEIAKLLNNDSQLRDEIQIAPERASEYQQMIDNEFANQGVTMISSEEVEKTVNNKSAEVDDSTLVSKYSQKGINMDRESLRMKIDDSIDEQLNKMQDIQGKGVDEIFEDIYSKKKAEVEAKFDQIEDETGKSVEDIFAEIYLKNRKSVDDIFAELYGESTPMISKENKSVEDYFTEIYTATNDVTSGSVSLIFKVL